MQPISETNQQPPIDRALALASLVRTMRSHYLAVRCSCGAERVIGLEAMARDRRYCDLTIAHVALRLACSGCQENPNEVYMTATAHGLYALSGGGGILWVMLLVQRPPDAYGRLRVVAGVTIADMNGELRGEHMPHGQTIPPPE